MKQYVVFLLIFLASCGAKKQAAIYEAQPLWLKQKPVVPGYYIGVGSAKKVGTPDEYKDQAKRDAMANLAEDISVTVSSTSVMRTIETNRGIIETFDQNIKVSTDDYLEGFEPVGFYDDELSYWVYYRLNENTYIEKKQLKKQAALNTAKSKYRSGLIEMGNNRPDRAITFYLQGLESIRNYLSEETTVQYNNAEMDVGNVLYSSLNEALSKMRIESILKETHVKRGEELSQTLLFKVFYKDQPVQGIPVKYRFSGSYLNRGSDVSDENGYVQLEAEKTESKKSQEIIFATIDFQSIASKAVDDLFIRGLINDYKSEPAKVIVNIQARSLAISYPISMCNVEQCNNLKHRFSQVVIKEGFEVQQKGQADFVFKISCAYTNGESADGLFSVYMNGDMEIIDKKGNAIWSGRIREIKGVGEGRDAARGKAFAELINKMGKIYFQQGISYLK